MEAQDSSMAPPATGGGRGLGTALGVIAMLLAVVALAANVVIPGPTGSQGPAGATGDQGPPGPGSLIFNATKSGSIVIANPCTNYANITVTVPGPGTVVVTASTRWSVNHTNGSPDNPRAFIGASTTDCTRDEYRVFGVVDPEAATGPHFLTLIVFKPFTVNAAGSYTYSVNGDLGNGNCSIYGAGIVAVFYPS